MSEEDIYREEFQNWVTTTISISADITSFNSHVLSTHSCTYTTIYTHLYYIIHNSMHLFMYPPLSIYLSI